jgi:sugar O-acyltransferase (sialic acid O-acetyltransferase NeuD family)
MKKLLIIGAGGFGREVYSWACDMPKYNVEWQIGGFIDDDLSALKGYDYPVGIISTLQDYIVQPNDVFVCAIGKPQTKQTCIDIIKGKGAKHFVNIIHPKAVVAKNVKFGEGVILCPMTVINADASLGNFVTINNHSNVGHNSVIGDWTQVSGYCDITGGVTVGQSVFFGSSAAVLPGIKISNNVIIGAGSIVVKNVEANATVFGNPAKKITF